MTIDEAIKIVTERMRLHRDIAESWVRTFADLGMIKLDSQKAEPPAAVPDLDRAPRCEPPEEHVDHRWHWLDVPGPNDTRRVGCFEWTLGSWWPLGRQVTPEIASAATWRYVEPATGPKDHALEPADRPAPPPPDDGKPKCRPPNLPLPRSAHLLKFGEQTVRAVWKGDSEKWLIPPANLEFTPTDLADLGYVYVAADPERAV